eukprot:tig00000219_g19491.t1
MRRRSSPTRLSYTQENQPPRRPKHQIEYEEFLELKARVAADERAMRTMLTHIDGHQNSTDSCLNNAGDALGLRLPRHMHAQSTHRDSAAAAPSPRPPHVIDTAHVDAHLIDAFKNNRAACFVTSSGRKFHFAGCPALYEGSLERPDYGRARPGVAGFFFGDEGEMRAWAGGKGLEECRVQRVASGFACTAHGSRP